MDLPITRRRLVGIAGVGTAVLLSGCGTLTEEGCESPGPDARAESKAATGDTVEAEFIASDEAPPEEYKYIESSDSVRYVAATSFGEPVEYDTMPWETFVRINGMDSARDRVAELISQGFPDADSLSTNVFDGEFPILVSLVTETEDGCVINKPSFSLEEVQNAVPGLVRTTVSVDRYQAVKEYRVGVRKSVTERADPV